MCFWRSCKCNNMYFLKGFVGNIILVPDNWYGNSYSLYSNVRTGTLGRLRKLLPAMLVHGCCFITDWTREERGYLMVPEEHSPLSPLVALLMGKVWIIVIARYPLIVMPGDSDVRIRNQREGAAWLIPGAVLTSCLQLCPDLLLTCPKQPVIALHPCII